MQQQQPGMQVQGAMVDEGKLKSAKRLRGCGGCGCAFAIALGIGAAVLVAFGSQRATKEAMPFGIILSGITPLVGIVALVLLIIGIMKVNEAKGG